MKNYFFLLLLLTQFIFSGNAQDWWTKTREEAIPPDLKSTTLLVERFKIQKPDEAPPQAYLDKEDRGEHPLIKKTNDHIEEYNAELKEMFKKYKFGYAVVSKKKTEDTEKYPHAQAKYVLKHEVYLRKYQENGVTRHYYTYLFYFYDRATEKSYPYIYLFDEKLLKSVETMIGYLNTL